MNMKWIVLSVSIPKGHMNASEVRLNLLDVLYLAAFTEELCESRYISKTNEGYRRMMWVSCPDVSEAL
jgi:hypothetical protein